MVHSRENWDRFQDGTSEKNSIIFPVFYGNRESRLHNEVWDWRTEGKNLKSVETTVVYATGREMRIPGPKWK